MPEQRAVDITELAVLGDEFSARLMLLGFRLMQVIDETEHDLFQYIVPPVCDVPEGTFTMGSDKHRDPKARDNEIPQYDIFVPAFQIGVYPLTVAEYCCAVKENAVGEPRTGGNIIWQVQQQHPDHPVVCITWHQAKEYAAWLAQVTGQVWRLPTEAEWEKAARGTDGRIYPWGDHWDSMKANTDDGGSRMTTPVGAYADRQDASPFGAHDMAGNVWEWTKSIYRNHPPYRANNVEKDADADSIRVLRGGSWYSHPLYARVAHRNHDYPMVAGNYVFGTRLVRGM